METVVGSLVCCPSVVVSPRRSAVVLSLVYLGVSSVKYTIHNVQCTTMYNVQFTIHNVLYTIYATKCKVV